jgi:hypothetical protein
MKMKMKYITLITVLAMVIIPFSCSKNFLNTTNTFQTTADGTFKTSQDVVGLINSIYDTYQSGDLLKKSIWYYANFQTHDWFNWGNDVQWNQFQIPVDFPQLPTFWNNMFIGIARANSAFGIIQTAKEKGIVTQELADRLTGEAYFLRGMSYYYLAGSFGGVPLELNAVTTGLTPRSSQDSVFMQVVSDMKQAESLLLSKTTLPVADLGRATKGAAYGFEGAAQMWLGNYTDALTAFNNPELTSNYHLLPKFIDVHEYSNQNNDESLFEVQFNAGGGSQSWDGSWQAGGEIAWIDSFSWPGEITQQGYDYGNPGLWMSYQDGDLRKYATIVGPGDTLTSPGIINYWGGIKGYPVVQNSYAAGDTTYAGDDGNVINTAGAIRHPWYGSDKLRSGYFCSKKWRDWNLTGNNPGKGGATGKIFGDQNQILLRYAEILLDRAECKIRTGDVAGGQADLKLVRDRAWGGNAPATMQDGMNYDGSPSVPITDPLQQVLSEYRHELTGDYSLFYNLRRAGAQTCVDFITACYGSGGLVSIPNPGPGPTNDGIAHGIYNAPMTIPHELLPIPGVARVTNPNLSQNPGY